MVISGPSGVGKGTLIGEVLPRLQHTVLSRSATTRTRRAEEKEGREYYFLTPGEFEERVKAGDFLEYVSYGNNRYGTLKSEVVRRLESGQDVILEIELEGARNIRRQMPEAVLIFIAPPSIEELRARLAGRNTEADAERNVRLERAGEELASQKEFDYIVVNQTVSQAADELEQFIKSSRAEISGRKS
ncbi:MAG: guanylate kinase [Thermoleophilia bacterium]